MKHPSAHHNPMLQDEPDLQSTHHHHHHEPDPLYQPIDPQIINQPSEHSDEHHNPFGEYHPHSQSHSHSHSDHHHHHHHHDTDFQDLLRATDVEDGRDAEAEAAVDRDLDMLIEQGDEDDGDHAMVDMDGSELQSDVGPGGRRGGRDDDRKAKGLLYDGFDG